MDDAFRVIVAGGRDFSDYELLKKSLDEILINKTNVIIISGCAKGADSLGEQYATEKGIPVEKFPADWNKNGKAAGPIRNIEMSKVGDALVAFWDHKSRGTEHMIKTMQHKGAAIRVITYTVVPNTTPPIQRTGL